MGEAVGLLHPGEMGASVGAALAAREIPVLWASRGRSGKTRARADAAGLRDVGGAPDLFRRCDLLLSVCPPHAALDVARAAAEIYARLEGYRDAAVPPDLGEVARALRSARGRERAS